MTTRPNSLRPASLRSLALVVTALLPSQAWAQRRFTLSHSLALAQLYDNNLFSVPSEREKDLVSRLTPGIAAEYRLAPATLRARYAFDAEFYPEHRDLSTGRARQEAAVALERVPLASFSFAAVASYAETQRPGELNLTTGLAAARHDARRLSGSPSLSRAFGRRTTADLGYDFTSDELSGGTAIHTHVARLGLKRRMSPRSSGRVAYSIRRFTFREAPDATAHVLTLGWDRQLTRRLRLEFDGGPRLSDGKLGPEVSIALHDRFRHGETTVAYSQTETTAIGEAGAVTAETVGATVSRQVFGGVQLSAGPSVWRSRRDGFEAMVYRGVVGAAFRVARRFSVAGSYQYSLQRGTLTAAAVRDIPHGLFMLTVSAAGS